jgi:L-iditol 2-dehydrogenase
VLLTRRSRPSLELVQRLFSIDRIIASSGEDLVAEVLEETDGRGADVIYLCAPSEDAQATAFRCAAPRARFNFSSGQPKGDNLTTIDANLVHHRELFIAGASSSLPEDNRKALDLLAANIIDPHKLITHSFSISDIVSAFDVAGSK